MRPTAICLAENQLIFNATAIAGIATNATSSPLANLFLSLHSAWPGLAGDQTTNEITSTNYARKSVTRDNTGFTCTNDYVTLASTAQGTFAAIGAGASQTAFFCCVGTLVSGAGVILACGALCSNASSTVESVVTNTDDTISWPAHGCSAGDRVSFYNHPGQTTLGTGLTAGTVYYVIASGLTTDALKVSATAGGTAVDITALGYGFGIRHGAGMVLNEGVTPIVGTGTRFRRM